MKFELRSYKKQDFQNVRCILIQALIVAEAHTLVKINLSSPTIQGYYC